MEEEQQGSIWRELRSQRDILIELRTLVSSVPDHENRLRKLEERRFPLATLSVLIAAIAVVVTVVGYVLMK